MLGYKPGPSCAKHTHAQSSAPLFSIKESEVLPDVSAAAWGEILYFTPRVDGEKEVQLPINEFVCQIKKGFAIPHPI